MLLLLGLKINLVLPRLVEGISGLKLKEISISTVVPLT